jgi:aspartyl-tRNA(Asn)/glutamyl-tRNA(Gln) amidotransferase subunit B
MSEISGKYHPTIGMEIHVELATQSKMFCTCQNGLGEETIPNKNICPICTGQPGSLAVPNQKAIEYVIKAGLALNCQIAARTKFDRKNYFYPDLPKGYQISQYDEPLCEKGYLELEQFPGNEQDAGGAAKRIGITRIHLEEDTGKSLHVKGANETLIDFNRAGVPLMELVTEPDIKTAKEAKMFCEELQRIFRYLEISPANMEKGQMRCEANISLYESGQDPLSGTKVELKNLNSFRAVERGIEYEIKRQSTLLEQGEKVVQETRGWDETAGKTFSQRVKEEADDYRYFPEPDILPLSFSSTEIEKIAVGLPELPNEKRKRFRKQFGLKREDIMILTGNQQLAEYFEETCSELEAWMGAGKQQRFKENKKKLYQLTANYLITEAQKYFSAIVLADERKVSPENFAELIKLIYEEKINSSAAQVVLKEMFTTGADPSHIIEEKNLAQTSNESELQAVVKKVLKANPAPVKDYLQGKEKSIQFLVGQVMRETKGKANPQVVLKLLKEQLIS